MSIDAIFSLDFKSYGIEPRDIPEFTSNELDAVVRIMDLIILMPQSRERERLVNDFLNCANAETVQTYVNYLEKKLRSKATLEPVPTPVKQKPKTKPAQTPAPMKPTWGTNNAKN